MITNDFKIAWRSMKKQRLFSIIKIGGFAFSIALCLLIVLFVKHELSYDRFYPDSDRVFRMVGIASRDGVEFKGVAMPAPTAGVLASEYASIENYGRMLSNPLFGAGSNQLSTEESPISYSDNGFTYIDQSMLEMIPQKVVYGSLNKALDQPLSMVLTSSKAAKYFEGNPVGKIIYLNNDKTKPYKIAAVIEDVPSNSHLYGFNFFMTLKGVEFYPGEQTTWFASNYSTYFKVKEGVAINELEKQLTKSYIQDHYIPAMEAQGLPPNPILRSAKVELQAINKIHLYSRNINDNKVEVQHRGDIKTVWIFVGISGFILLIATINFINLSTANAVSRAKEVGIRKTIGSNRKTLIKQFLLESCLFSLISIVISILLAIVLLPLFNNLAGKELTLPWSSWYFLPSMFLFALVVGLLAGIYPAIYLSSFKPISVLKGTLATKSGSGGFRNSLVVFQFVASIVLIISTILMNQQMNYLMDKDLGFNKNQVLILHGSNTLEKKINSFKSELQQIPSVESISVGDYLPVMMEGVKRNGNAFWIDGQQNTEVGKGGQFWRIDTGYLKTFEIKLLSGRNLDLNIASDSSAVLVNQQMLKELGIKDPIGTKIRNYATFTIVGVVEDFVFGSLKEEGTKPLALSIGGTNSLVSIKIKANQTAQSIRDIEKVWDKFAPNQKIEYSFLDDNFAALYADVEQVKDICTAFACIAIGIACLGLFGLSAYITEQRTKEIGVRKVLGASIAKIIRLLSLDFLKLVVIAIIIAIPIAWWAMNNWLQDFSNRISIHWWIFAIAAGVSLLIAMLTISYHAFRSANMNPIKSLRDE